MGYHLTKRVISNYLRSNCKRRLSLDLVPETKANQSFRDSLDMPFRFVARPGMRIIQDQGDEWERLKLGDLERAFGTAAMLSKRIVDQGEVYFEQLDLLEALRTGLRPEHRFIIQGRFGIELDGAFEVQCELQSLRRSVPLTYGDLIPDIVQVLKAGSVDLEVLPNGSLAPVATDDSRVPLRVIDVKLTAEASNAYFGEVTYYSMTLAALLADYSLSGQFFVSPNAGVWTGSHDASSLSVAFEALRAKAQVNEDALLQAMEKDLETVPFEVFAPRLRRFFRDELPFAINNPWRAQSWHVGTQCSGCEYLGLAWQGSKQSPDDRHCYPTAQATDDLSRVPFVSRGAKLTLQSSAITTVAALADAGVNHPGLRQHQTLRATKTVVSGRARAIATKAVVSPPDVGTSALLPTWADLRIFITADFDIGSGVTGILGLSGAFWNSQTRTLSPIAAEVFVVDAKSLTTELRELLRFLAAIHTQIEIARQIPNATIQVYIWDQATYDQIVRVIGRHLPVIVAQNRIADLIWLFPPDEIVPNPDLSDRHSPVCLVQAVVKAVVAAPVDHYYSLLRLARTYHRADLDPAFAGFQVNNHFEDPFTDQIPSERLHEMWAREDNWATTLETLKRTTKTKLRALSEVTRHLESSLKDSLNQNAPRISDLRAPTNRRSLAEDSKLWLMFAEWDSALSKLKNEQIKAMPEHEREARFASALLSKRLTGESRALELARLGIVGTPDVEVYELGADSVDFKGKEGDFTFGLRSPRWQSLKLKDLADLANLDASSLGRNSPNDLYVPVDTILQVTILRLDRETRHIVLELSQWWSTAVQALLNAGALNLDGPVFLDPTYRDFITDRIREVLVAIGSPTEATPSSVIATALPASRRGRAASASSAVSKVLWNPTALQAETTGLVADGLLAQLLDLDTVLNESQWTALKHALSQKLTLIWGPPGTGKSKTLRAIIKGIGLSSTNTPLKVLLTGPTYEALDNIMVGGPEFSACGFARVERITSSTRILAPINGSVVKSLGSTQEVLAELNSIRNSPDSVLVSATPQQVYKLVKSSGQALHGVFDFVIIDEASQMDVGVSSLSLCGLKDGGAVIIAGDPLQLPPIHQAVPDESYSYLVSSIFEYLLIRFGCSQCLLNRSYRSNQEIVSIGYQAGYSREFVADDPNKRLKLSVKDQDLSQPDAWPSTVPWSDSFADMLRSDRPVTCFLYGDGKSCQSNLFEAQTVVSLVRLSRLVVTSDVHANQLCDDDEFWTRKVGIVTPHRAQQSLVTRLLQTAFPDTDRTIIRAAVDTVERFQGQEREIIMATYAVGDEDAIGQEEVFLMSLNRFNVTASRAKTKLIVLLTQELIDHLASDSTALVESSLLKSFVESICVNSAPMQLPGPDGVVIGKCKWN